MTGSPRLLSLEICGKEVEGSVLHVEKKYWGGEEGNSIFCWVVVCLLAMFSVHKVTHF